MTPEKWEKISELYHSAIELEASKRKAYLDSVCGRDETLRREVESLLEADRDAGEFIQEPIVGNNPPKLDSPSSNSFVGKMIAHYRIESSIGSGGMGEVYLATDTRLGRKVAIKALPPEIADDPNYLKRFRNEAMAAATINHPNVATIYSVEDNGNMPFITMEFIKGRSLDREIPAEGLPIPEFVDWFTQLADALSHAHSKGVVHRDVKPGNVMIVDGSVPKILDFGLALIDPVAVERDAFDIHITKPGQILGTPSYMSPEQAEGKSVDHRTDIFSLGVMMYEAITGQRPFTGDSHAEIVSNLLRSEPKPIAEVRPEVPAPLVQMIERCIAKPRKARFRSMAEVYGVLSTMRSYLRTGGSLESLQHRLFRESRSSSAMWLPVAAVFVAIAAFGFWYYFSSGRTDPALNFADLTFRKLSQSNNVIFAHITADGNSIVYNSVEDNEMRAMYVRRIDDRNALQLVPPQRVQYWGGLSTSRDGHNIFYITAERAANHGTLFRIPSLGGTPRKLVETVNDLGSLSPDGEQILYVRYGDNTDILSAKTFDGSDETVIHTAAQPALFKDPQYSTDGSFVFTIRFDVIDGVENWSVVKIPAGGGEESVVIPKQRPRINELVVLRDGSGLLMNATDPISNLAQLYFVSLPSGQQTRITNDLNTYFGVSADETGQTIVSAQRHDEVTIWVGDPSDVSSLKRILPEPNAYTTAEFAPNGTIIYDAYDNNRPHIFSIGSDGGNLQQLTPNDTSDHHPNVTPDGRYIVFTSNRTGEDKIWRMNIDGSEPVLLTPGEMAASHAEISSDGKLVYFSYNRDLLRRVGVVPVEGGPIVDAPFTTESYWALSADGSRVAFTKQTGGEKRPIMVLRTLDGSEPDRSFPVSPIHFIKWTSDHKGLIYRERETGENPYATVWRLDPDTGDTKAVLSVAPDSILDLSYDATGKNAVMVRGKLLSDAVMMTTVKRESIPEEK